MKHWFRAVKHWQCSFHEWVEASFGAAGLPHSLPPLPDLTELTPKPNNEELLSEGLGLDDDEDLIGTEQQQSLPEDLITL